MDPQTNPIAPSTPIATPPVTPAPVTRPTIMPSMVTPSPVTTPPAASSLATTSTKKVGPVIAIFVVLVLIIVAVIYLFASRSNMQQQVPVDNAIASQLPAAATQGINNENSQTVQPIMNTTDDLQSLQNDLNNSTAGIDTQNF